MEPREDARVSGEAARNTRVSSRVTSRDSPKWRAYSQATSVHEPIQIILHFLKVFQQMMTWIVAIHDRYWCPPPPKKKCVHVGVLSQSFESGTSLFMSKRSFFAFNFQAVRAM